MVHNRRIGNHAGVARDAENIGIVYTRTKKYRLAQRWLERAMKMHEGSDNPDATAMVMNNLAASLRVQGLTARAGVLVRQAVTISRRVGRPLGVASALEGRARIEYAVGQRSAAMQSARDAYRIARKGPYREVLTDAAELLAHIHSDLGRNGAGRRWLERGIIHARTIGDRGRVAELEAFGRRAKIAGSSVSSRSRKSPKGLRRTVG